jgi:hypothetical protein
LTQIDKLARVTDYPLQHDYQWLCNVVHPSVGGFAVFSDPPISDDRETHALIRISKEVRRNKLHLEDAPETGSVIIEEVLARMAILAVEVLEKTLDGALRVIDDIALTTKAR